jgi:hypothetical protein
MIRLNCTSCREAMEIDEAFAGGVCRCRSCGTIQTVPAGGGNASQQHAIFRGAVRSNPTRSLKSPTATAAAAPASIAIEPPPARHTLLFFGGGALIVALLAVIAFLVLKIHPLPTHP